MDLITRAHRDSSYPSNINIDHAQFQVFLLHVLFVKGFINDEFVEFLFWLFEILSRYQFIDKVKEINIEISHLNWLIGLSSKVEKLCANKSDNILKEYTYLKDAIDSIYQEMKIIYIEKYLTNLFEKYSNAKWLEVVIHFPETFEENNDQCIRENQTSTDMNIIDKIQEIIFERVFILQEEKLNKFYKLMLKEKSDLENGFKQLNGYLYRVEISCSFQKKSPYEVLTFNNLIDTFNNRLERDGGPLIKLEIFLKVQQCLCCFQDIRLATEKLSSSPQID
ncbi:unnamed protein product [Didymodactylos carnosus]|uniref:Uncharacterized protein n=1 Tax=Didymodactylos carnosus TaxID=1234261 RepID=A0A8S2MWU6_9BILA|nr:unnamed protein product [Didymodactylos carnosus]CAF3977144.1 unnamed protein product [Didymodactylos carnosus]